MKALIVESKVVQISEQEFPVHSSFIWVEIPEGSDVQENDFYENGEFIPNELYRQ